MAITELPRKTDLSVLCCCNFDNSRAVINCWSEVAYRWGLGALKDSLLTHWTSMLSFGEQNNNFTHTSFRQELRNIVDVEVQIPTSNSDHL